MTQRTTDSIISLPKGLDSDMITSRDVTRMAVGAAMDPFLIASHFDMKGPVFPPHPHAGFAVMTYILPESETGFLNQDSTGLANEIAPGDLHVTVAGRGLQHEETNVEPGKSALGFQIWIDLPDAHRQDDPSAFHLTADAVSVIAQDGATVRVLAGASNGATSPVALPSSFRLIDVTLAPGAVFEQDLTPTEMAYLHVLSGTAMVSGDTASANEALFTQAGGTNLTVTAGPDGTRVVLFAGEPLRQTPVFGGPFVASDEQELSGFKRAFAKGEMGHLTAFANKIAA